MNPVRDWKSSLAVVPFLVIAFLVWGRIIDAPGAVALLAATSAYLATVAGDSKPKDS